MRQQRQTGKEKWTIRFEKLDGPRLTAQEMSAQHVAAKQRGAYYTDATVADFLVRWAIVTGREKVFDPGFGGGVFLTAAARRLRTLGGDPRSQLYGIELDGAAYRAFAQGSDDVSTARLLHANFFDLRPGDIPAVDAVVGNPPFIRYQRFNGEVRRTALRRACEAGVSISRLTSSWAPFLVHATQFVKPSGRLAMVAPAELAHAGYARPVLDYLRRSFRTTRILCFSRRLFPKLSEDTVLVLAAGHGEPFESFVLFDLPDAWALADCSDPATDLPGGVQIDPSAVGQGRERLLHYLLPKRTRELYRRLQVSTQVAPLGELADVGTGYVTGDNSYFHVGQTVVQSYELPQRFLRPAARSSSDVTGLRFTRQDWEALHRAGAANLLLHLPGGQQLPDSVQAYLRQGVLKGVPTRYKCRVRDPWYWVPHVYQADGFLTYMSGSAPKLVANEADAVAPNTLHVVRLLSARRLDALGLATAWQASLSALSCELEGHSLGGGMLKLEPTEAGRVLIAVPDLDAALLTELAVEVDALLREGRAEAARARTDALMLRRGLGLSEAHVQALREGWLSLRARRLNR
ncbi:MAG: N-6 DNA methylase [Chloroflexi bacterium]|nr:N-6 DNA methylase [Chloroflexota bacterium]